MTSFAWISHAKSGATRKQNQTVLRLFALPFARAFAIALGCFGNDKIASLVIFATFALVCFVHKDSVLPYDYIFLLL